MIPVFTDDDLDDRCEKDTVKTLAGKTMQEMGKVLYRVK